MCVDRQRHRARSETAHLADHHAQAEAESDPVLLAERNELRDRIWRAIMELSPQHREIIVMGHFQHMSYEQMSTSLGILIGTVMSRLYYARKALRQKLADEKP